jgi:hypothetical protein
MQHVQMPNLQVWSILVHFCSWQDVMTEETTDITVDVVGGL